uniref:Uncharacterized protein n=1 Tax=Thermogemmatispora argillosa TaxID=2045280 RepID=A0A455SZY8_9CHLR|nr:hypothetical protein KTA_14390 [Thermogemmatispora argillosa]
MSSFLAGSPATLPAGVNDARYEVGLLRSKGQQLIATIRESYCKATAKTCILPPLTAAGKVTLFTVFPCGRAMLT